MSSPWLLLDVSYLGYRSLYSIGDLSYQGISTGVVYGIFQTVLDLFEVHATNRVVWCFDRGCGKRQELSPTYKQNRHVDEDEEKKEALLNLRNQLYKMRTEYLPDIGCHNVFWQDDYEADDVIASVCKTLSRDEKAVIVSADEDLFQLLDRDRVIMWNLNKRDSMTESKFNNLYGIGPKQWADVKAIAGCSGDNVIGISGVGNKTAAKFLAGSLSSTTKKFQAIVDGNDVWKKNLPLVTLPFPGTRKFELVDDGDLNWDRVFHKLGIVSLKGSRAR